MISEEQYRQYIADFNAACDGDGSGFGAFYDKWYAPDAVFEYIPTAKKNVGREVTVAFWRKVHDLMHEQIRDHTSFLTSATEIATEAPIDFYCKQDLEWVGVKYKKGTSFRLLMAGFYRVGENNKIESVRVYSIYNPAYQVKPASA